MINDKMFSKLESKSIDLICETLKMNSVVGKSETLKMNRVVGIFKITKNLTFIFSESQRRGLLSF